MSDAGARMITAAEAAQLMGFKPDTLRAWRRESRGPAYCQFGRAVRYALCDVERYIAAGRVGQREELGGQPPQTIAGPGDAS